MARMMKNKPLRDEERRMVSRVLKFFEEEKLKGSFVIPVGRALKRTSAATGVSFSTILRIKTEQQKFLQGITQSPAPSSSEPVASTALSSGMMFSIPKKKRCPPPNKLFFDDAIISSLIDLVNTMQKPSLSKILAVAKRDLNFPGQKETLRKVLSKSLGKDFHKYFKRNSKKNKGENKRKKSSASGEVEAVCESSGIKEEAEEPDSEINDSTFPVEPETHLTVDENNTYNCLNT